MQKGILNRLISDPLSLGWWNNYPRFWAHHRRYSLPIRVPLRTRQRGVCCSCRSLSNTTCQVLSRRSWWIVGHWCHVRVGGNAFLIYYTLGHPKIFEVSITQPANWSLCQNVMAVFGALPFGALSQLGPISSSWFCKWASNNFRLVYCNTAHQAIALQKFPFKSINFNQLGHNP